MALTTHPDTISWFEVPTTDIARATAFYEQVFQFKTQPIEMEGYKMSILPGMDPKYDGQIVHGALIQGDTYTPGHSGAVVYFNGGEDLTVPLSRVEAAGGKVLQEKFAIGEHGFIGFFEDTEGNRIGLHSVK